MGIVGPNGFTVTADTHNFRYTVTGKTITLTSISGITITYQEADFNGYGLDVVSGGKPIIGVTINPATTQPGIVPGRIGFDSTHVWLNMEDLVSEPGSVVKLDLQFSSDAT